MWRLPFRAAAAAASAVPRAALARRGLADEFVRTKPHLNVGTIGHVDHGKVCSARIMLYELYQNLTCWVLDHTYGGYHESSRGIWRCTIY